MRFHRRLRQQTWLYFCRTSRVRCHLTTRHRRPTPTTSKPGRSLSGFVRRRRAASIATPVPKPWLRYEMSTTDFSSSFLCSLATGKSTPTWSSIFPARSRPKWSVPPAARYRWKPRLTNVQIYERGCASITNCVDLWTSYCSFKMETTHTPHIVRE